MDRRAWWATVHRVAKSWTRLSDCTYLEPVKPFTSQIQKVAKPFPEHLRPRAVREVAVPRAGIREKRLRWVGWGTQLEKGRVFCSLLRGLSGSGLSAPLVPLLGSGGGLVTSPLGSLKSMHMV